MVGELPNTGTRWARLGQGSNMPGVGPGCGASQLQWTASTLPINAYTPMSALAPWKFTFPFQTDKLNSISTRLQSRP